MSQKTKIIDTATDKLTDIAQQAGLLLMTAATVIGMVELPDKTGTKLVLPMQPVFSSVTDNNNEANNPLRREREEAGPHYISYAVTQRTPGRSSKQ